MGHYILGETERKKISAPRKFEKKIRPETFQYGKL
jgi:hypothetical protein